MLLTRTNAFVSAVCLTSTIAFAGPVGLGQDAGGSLMLTQSGSSQSLSSISLTSPVGPGSSEAVVRSLYPGLGSTLDRPVAADSSSATVADPQVGANPFALPQPVRSTPMRTASTPAANPFNPVNGRGADISPDAQAPAFAISGQDVSADDATKPERVDETALRYYADQRNLERVGAEIRRLKALYPAWNPPADLFAPKSTVDEQPIWDLYKAGRIAEAQQKIHELRKGDPNYRPSADLLSKLDDAEARTSIKAASNAGDWATTLAVAQKRPGLLVCAEIDVLWRVGEAFAKSDDLARAFDLYRYILTNCTNPAERMATMQKAASVLPQKGVDALVSYGGTRPDGTGEFDTMRFQKVRTLIGNALSDKTASHPIDPDELAGFEGFVKSGRSADDAGLLGWYNYGRSDFAAARDWFELGSRTSSDPKLLEGYILSIRNLGDLKAAEDLAYRNHDRSPTIAKIYVELVADRLNDAAESEDEALPDLDRFKVVVSQSRSALGAQTLGWKLVDDKAYAEAKDWFQKSVDWQVTEEGVVGLAVVASRMKDKSELKAVKAKYGDEFAALAEFKDYQPPARQAIGRSGTHRRSTGGSSGGDRLLRQANSQFEAGDYQAALSTLNRREARSGKSYGAEILRGWINIKLKRWDDAERIFRAQDRKRSTKDTRFGIGAVSNSRYGMWPEETNNCTVRWKC
ncbi:MAG: hypothetical protein VYD57_08280 [Pseudomonadota bacterium]|nr:hypothetical protein [Pseudomonadota bacterium]